MVVEFYSLDQIKGGRKGTVVEIRRFQMSEYRIAIVLGSLRRDYYNRKRANAIKKLAPPEFSFQDWLKLSPS